MLARRFISVQHHQTSIIQLAEILTDILKTRLQEYVEVFNYTLSNKFLLQATSEKFEDWDDYLRSAYEIHLNIMDAQDLATELFVSKRREVRVIRYYYYYYY